tara:strand:+ start:3825 stop:5363 length:1539 start_codon:yes stop_codon:yes gene_type:complete
MIRKVIALILVVSCAGILLAQDNPEKDLLANAIKVYASISPDEDIKTRLRKQELAIRKVDEILAHYSGTDTGLELLSTDKFGKFDAKRLREQYLKELITFNLKTCESTPSFTCLGFLSLDNGNKQCQNPKEFSQFLTASNNFQNAYRIFRSQGDAKKYELGVLSAYRQCANRAPNDFSKDFINSRLVNILLDNGEESRAVGITQNMTTKLFKIIAAADIRVTQGKYGYATYKTILENAESLNKMTDRESALLILTNKLFEVGLNPFSQEANDLGVQFVLQPNSYFSEKKMGMHGKCNSQEEYLSELAMDHLFHAVRGAKDIIRFGQVMGNPGWVSPSQTATYINTVMEVFHRANSCSNYNVDSILYFIKTDPEVAGNLRGYQLEKGVGEKDGVDFFLKTLTTDQIIDYQTHRTGVVEATEKMFKSTGQLELFMQPRYWKDFMYPFYGKYGQFSIFKVFVDAAEVCNASSKLFQEIRGGEYEDEAVTYFISSPNISVDKKYICGDADLDLLLN